jgi:hypothetical protein
VVENWTAPPLLAGRPVRVGEAIPAEEAVDLEPWRRMLWMVFRAYDPSRPSPGARLEGGVLVEGREDFEGEPVVALRTTLRQEHVGETGPRGPKGIRTEYAARYEARDRLAARDGLRRTHDASRWHRFRYAADDFDYAVDVWERTSLRTTR